MESKAQRNERLRKMRQKYGLGEYKNKVHKRKRRYNIVAKKRSRSRGKSSFLSSGLMGKAAGIGALILFETIVEPKVLAMANVSNPTLVNAGELVLGMYLARKGGIVGEMGKAAVVVNLYQILYPYLSQVGNGFR